MRKEKETLQHGDLALPVNHLIRVLQNQPGRFPLSSKRGRLCLPESRPSNHVGNDLETFVWILEGNQPSVRATGVPCAHSPPWLELRARNPLSPLEPRSYYETRCPCRKGYIPSIVPMFICHLRRQTFSLRCVGVLCARLLTLPVSGAVSHSSDPASCAVLLLS